MSGSYQTQCWHCDGPAFTAAASFCPWCGADLDGADPDPEPRLWNTIQREGLDDNPWDPTFVFEEPVVILDEASPKGVGRTDFSMRLARQITKIRKTESAVVPIGSSPIKSINEEGEP